MQGLRSVKTNVQAFGYAIASVMSWRKHPEKPIDGLANTWAGRIVANQHWVQKNWALIDEMFDKDERTLRSLELILDADSPEKRTEFRKEYGQYWAAHVLGAAMFSWSDTAAGRIREDELESLWLETRDYWNTIVRAVDGVQWNAEQWREADLKKLPVSLMPAGGNTQERI
jgi:hypothetical protein